MNSDTINRAVAAAHEFQRRANIVLAGLPQHGVVGFAREAGPRETGDLRRMSMELTRALADMRRPG